MFQVQVSDFVTTIIRTVIGTDPSETRRIGVLFLVLLDVYSFVLVVFPYGKVVVAMYFRTN
jgi:hypothetical protein